MTEKDKFVFSNCNRELVQNSISYQHCGKIKQHHQQHNKRRPCLKKRRWQLALPLRWNKDIRWSKLTKQLSYRTTLSCFAQLHLLPPQVAGRSSNLFISVEDTECPFGNSVFFIKKDVQGVRHYMLCIRLASPPKSKSFARGLQSTKPVANDRLEFAIAIAEQNKIFKVCGFTYTLRQFFAPVFAQECQCYHRLVVTLLPTEREARSGSTRKSDSSKSKRDAQGVPFAFWWNRRELNPCPKTS